jgi:hypothetical protein
MTLDIIMREQPALVFSRLCSDCPFNQKGCRSNDYLGKNYLACRKYDQLNMQAVQIMAAADRISGKEDYSGELLIIQKGNGSNR